LAVAPTPRPAAGSAVIAAPTFACADLRRVPDEIILGCQETISAGGAVIPKRLRVILTDTDQT
jgi:hypothetical protein